MPRLMSFDFGTKRLGIAVTDPLQMFATGLTTIHPKDCIEFLTKYLMTEQVALFIVGEPKQMNGLASQSAPQVKGFVTMLKKHFPAIPVEMIDERFTSKMASATIAQSGLKKSDRHKKDLVDTVSAVIILQSYLEKRSLGF
ncbi:MAG: Holliday junction resolvase RuvX [Bacteroidetes bacterium]|nr:Holliday junction resolvase RuvX [Bacteroidota bacterium]MBU1373904.1 Holliday junction resolvase RuvX [Bacteroidota bacterium]MBU1485509.1 Holliday junction resolvase RuvX [Bacteroidota bacterium]MBU1760731.1 Holliday junction resolvase RuvX [Bacteroidota bacterium]MBU2045701.1 Holliday junction resolvase RuvX [Bacteroidota bacterium]